MANPAYSLFMLLALTVFLLARHFQAKATEVAPLPWQHKLLLALAALIGGAFGAKLPFVVMGTEAWYTPRAWFSNGKTITTGLLGAYVAVEIAKLCLGVRSKTGDGFAIPLALALAIGRWGCFFNGCCYGAPTDLPWGIDYGDGIARHPTQIYEVLFHFTMGMVCWYLIRTGRLRHQRLKLYLITYGIYRFFTEWIRPEPRDFAGLTLYQWVAIVMVVGLTLQWIYDAAQLKATGSHSRLAEAHQ